MPDLYAPAVLGAPADATEYNENWDLVEDTIGALGPYVVSGLVPSIGTGLSVDVTAGEAIIGGLIAYAAFTIGGLSPSSTNHLYVLQDGTATSNTTGTAPADSAKIGTALTGVSTVTSVAATWASGRQFHVKNKDEVHGAGAGHPRAIDLASWHATANEGFEVKGVLPSGAGGGTLAQATKTINYVATVDDYFLWVDATAGNVTIFLYSAVGNAGKSLVVKKIDASANTVTLDAALAETVDGAVSVIITSQWASYSIASNGSDWYIY